jgi:molybdopterin synthase catalytic subunit/molybdopterin synthase sulfur carrier subunit
MARLRLFANLREIAGTGAVDVDGGTVDEVLQSAIDRFGSDFARALGPAQVWVDGERAGGDSPVSADSEVAAIPPVSGGAMLVRSPMAIEISIVGVLAAALFGANAVSLQWFAVTVVLVVGVWAFDITTAAERRDLPVASVPAVTAALGGVLATYRFGANGMATATIGAVLLALVWSVFSHRLRSIDSITAGAMIAVCSALGSSALVLLRLRSYDETQVFLFVAAIAVFVSWLSDRSEMPIVDPLVAMLIGAILGGAVAGAFWAPDLLAAIGGAIAGAIALVAGRNLGMLIRAGGFFVGGPAPGSLSYLDGMVIAAAAFWTLVTILS